jgi:hypothetical protein
MRPGSREQKRELKRIATTWLGGKKSDLRRHAKVLTIALNFSKKGTMVEDGRPLEQESKVGRPVRILFRSSRVRRSVIRRKLQNSSKLARSTFVAPEGRLVEVGTKMKKGRPVPVLKRERISKREIQAEFLEHASRYEEEALEQLAASFGVIRTRKSLRFSCMNSWCGKRIHALHPTKEHTCTCGWVYELERGWVRRVKDREIVLLTKAGKTTEWFISWSLEHSKRRQQTSWSSMYKDPLNLPDEVSRDKRFEEALRRFDRGIV